MGLDRFGRFARVSVAIMFICEICRTLWMLGFENVLFFIVIKL